MSFKVQKGLVNYNEFAVFFDAWLAHDPNDPGYSPEPEEYQRWSKVRDYNFDKDGTSQYQIDVDDLMYLANEWAWAACWKQSQLDLFDYILMEMAMGGGGMEMLSMPMSFGFASPQEPQPEPVKRTTAELVSLAEGIYGIIEYVDSVEKTDENAENLYDIKVFLEDVLRDLQEEHQQKKT